MIAFLRNLFGDTPTAPGHRPTDQADIALGALLVRIARVDGAYLFQEAEQIEQVLALRYALTPGEAKAMRQTCEAMEEQMPSALELMGRLHDHIPEQDRRAIVSALWSVVFADRVEHQDEDSLIQVIEDVLGVPRQQSLLLRAHEYSRANPRWARSDTPLA